METERQKVFALLDAHSQQAARSEYDASVCVLAVGRARDVVGKIPDDVPEAKFREQAQKCIAGLIDGYRDEDGQFTSGRSVLVPILDDLSRSFGWESDQD